MVTFDNASQFQGNLAEYLIEHLLGIIAYTNADIKQVRKLAYIKGIHLIRDPYKWLLRAGVHWGLVDERDLSVQDDIRALLNRAYAVLQTLSRNRLRLQSTVASVPAPTFLEIAYKHRFERNSRGRKLGQEDTASHYRKGVAGDWKEHFSPEVTAHFEERFTNLLEKLAYS